jgi:ankyrin repeat protein
MTNTQLDNEIRDLVNLTGQIPPDYEETETRQNKILYLWDKYTDSTLNNLKNNDITIDNITNLDYDLLPELFQHNPSALFYFNYYNNEIMYRYLERDFNFKRRFQNTAEVIGYFTEFGLNLPYNTNPFSYGDKFNKLAYDYLSHSPPPRTQNESRIENIQRIFDYFISKFKPSGGTIDRSTLNKYLDDFSYCVTYKARKTFIIYLLEKDTDLDLLSRALVGFRTQQGQWRQSIYTTEKYESLSSVININQTDIDGIAAIHLILSIDDLPHSKNLLELLIEAGADVSLKELSDKHQTPVIILSNIFEKEKQDHQALIDIYKLLSNHGAKFDEKDEDGNTVLLYTAMKGMDRDVFEYLFSREDIKSIVNHRNNYGDSAIYEMAETVSDREVYDMFLEIEGINVDPNSDGRTPLMNACIAGNVDMVYAFYDADLSAEENNDTYRYTHGIDHQDNDGNTALIYACKNNNFIAAYNMIKILRGVNDTRLEKTADISIVNKAGQTAFKIIYSKKTEYERKQLARQFSELTKLLLSHADRVKLLISHTEPDRKHNINIIQWLNDTNRPNHRGLLLETASILEIASPQTQQNETLIRSILQKYDDMKTVALQEGSTNTHTLIGDPIEEIPSTMFYSYKLDDGNYRYSDEITSINRLNGKDPFTNRDIPEDIVKHASRLSNLIYVPEEFVVPEQTFRDITNRVIQSMSMNPEVLRYDWETFVKPLLAHWNNDVLSDIGWEIFTNQPLGYDDIIDHINSALSEYPTLITHLDDSYYEFSQRPDIQDILIQQDQEQRQLLTRRRRPGSSSSESSTRHQTIRPRLEE